MQVNIYNKENFKIKGKSFVIKNRNEAKEIRQEFFKKYEQVLKDIGSAYGLMEYNALEQNYNYFLGFKASDKNLPDEDEFISYDIAKAPYLEVEVNGEDGLDEGYDYVYHEFFPNKKYFHGLGPDIEFYKYDQSNISDVKLYICLKENPHS